MADKMNLMSLWTKDKDTKEKENLEQAYDELMADAGKVVIQKKGAITKAKRVFGGVLENAHKNPNFQTLLDAYVTMKAAQADYDLAVELNEAISGESK
jgi:hypothetical protein